MKTTEQRIQEIIKDVDKQSEGRVDYQILRLELENLVIQAQLEQLQKD